MRTISRACFLTCLLAGCGRAPEPVAAPVAALVEAPAPSLEPPPPSPPAHDDRMTLLGMVTLPRSVAGLANAREGVVVGTPVTVLDLLSGQRLGQGSTFYDGSYTVELPARLARRPVVLKVELVDAANQQLRVPLYAPAVLAPEDGRQTLDVGPGSTAWLALLYAMAARQSAQPAPDWTVLMPGLATRTLAELIVGTQPNARWSFTSFAEADGTLGRPQSATELRQAIDGLVAKLVATAKPAS